jgi:hypothetical protein
VIGLTKHLAMQLTNLQSTQKPIIVILLGAPFTSQNYERTGVPYLKANFEVAVLDCTPWLRIGYDRLRFRKHDYPQVITICTADEFAEAIGQIKPAYAIDCIGANGVMRFIQKVLRMHGTKFVVQKTGILPVPLRRQRARELLTMAANNPQRFFLKLIAKLSSYVRGKRALKADVALLAGRKSLDSYTIKAKSILWIASGDYYTYKGVQDKAVHQDMGLPFRGKYSLFIDDCIALASDYTLLGHSLPVDPDRYYALLRQAFDRLEHITGLQIVVAAHPNGKEIEGYTSLFGARQVYFDITAELCSRSDLVSSHISTALSYVVLWGKPLIILTSRTLDESYQGAAIRERSRQLDCPLLFMEADEEEYRSAYKRSKQISAEAYKCYIENFIKTAEVTEVAPWQAFTDFVKQDKGREVMKH